MALSLSWEEATGLAIAGGALGGALGLTSSRKSRAVGAFVREGAMLLALYAIWRLAGQLSIRSTDDAMGRAEWIRSAESALHVPSEASVQALVLGHPPLVEAANIYYAVVHFPGTIIFLAWLFIRHRNQYRPVRWVLVLTTLCCLLIQLMPVAPPRMLPGIVDTGVAYGQSVYAAGFDADQFSAMPSVHAAWAFLVGYYIWRVARSRWRFVGPLHAAVTLAVVLVTGNHWWLDCVAAAVVLVACAWMVAGFRAVRATLRTRFGAAKVAPATPVSVAAPVVGAGALESALDDDGQQDDDQDGPTLGDGDAARGAEYA